jgi:hypothetical protein
MLKGNMSGDVHDFKKIKMRAPIKIFFLQDKTPKKIHAILTKILGQNEQSYATVKHG